MAKKTIKPRPVMLQEVKVTASPIKKMKMQEETVRLYPRGEKIKKRTVDSLAKTGLAKAIGKPIMKSGQKQMYGTNASDVIKKALKKK